MPSALQNELAKKIRLENRLRLELRGLYNQILRDYRALILSGYEPTPRSGKRYKSAVEAVLYRHYDRVQQAFTTLRPDGSRRKQQDDETESEKRYALLLLLLLEWRDRRAPMSAERITDTAGKDMVSARREALEGFLETEQRAPMNVELAALATINLRRKLYGRENGVSILETQAPAENAKLTEGMVDAGYKESDIRSSLSGGRPLAVAAGATPMVKTWRTVGDDKVRPAHAGANHQTKPVTEPFVVGGEMLMYPGDTDLGASIGNVINCRCSAVYESAGVPAQNEIF